MDGPIWYGFVRARELVCTDGGLSAFGEAHERIRHGLLSVRIERLAPHTVKRKGNGERGSKRRNREMKSRNLSGNINDRACAVGFRLIPGARRKVRWSRDMRIRG